MNNALDEWVKGLRADGLTDDEITAVLVHWFTTLLPDELPIGSIDA